MNTQLMMTETSKPPALLRFTCWAVWLVAVPAMLLSLLILAGVPIFEGVTNVTVGLPLPMGLIPLLLVTLSTVGLWRRQMWGVLLYGAAGLLGVAVMLFHPAAMPVFANTGLLANIGLSDTFAWMGIGVIQVIYTWLMWTQVADPRA